MEIIKTFSNGNSAIKCPFCEGSGAEPIPENFDDELSENCSVCGGTGMIIEAAEPDLLFDCARCGGGGKIMRGGYYMGDTCTVCNGKGYIRVGLSNDSEIWSLLHPRVAHLARELFYAKNYTEAVAKCIRELNVELKEYHGRQSGEELDGYALIGKLLSVEKPVLKIADLGTDSGRNQQRGVMQIMQGLFLGVRNPIFHDQTIGSDYCIHSLFLISFIHHQLDYSALRSAPNQ